MCWFTCKSHGLWENYGFQLFATLCLLARPCRHNVVTYALVLATIICFHEVQIRHLLFTLKF
jgi:hypothetical protein